MIEIVVAALGPQRPDKKREVKEYVEQCYAEQLTRLEHTRLRKSVSGITPSHEEMASRAALYRGMDRVQKLLKPTCRKRQNVEPSFPASPLSALELRRLASIQLNNALLRDMGLIS